MPSGPKEMRDNKHQVKEKKRADLMDKLHQHEEQVAEEERLKKEFEEEDEQRKDDSKAQKRHDARGEAESKAAEEARRKFEAKAEWARENGDVPPASTGWNRRNYSQTQTSADAAVHNPNHGNPANPEVVPTSQHDVERILNHPPWGHTYGSTQKYRPPKKDHEWKREEKRVDRGDC